MKIIECDQYSSSWWAARCGVPTSSEFGSIMTPKRMELASAADSYIARLIGDRYDPYYPRVSEYVSPAMRHGTDSEAESRRWYEMETGLEVRRVGFVLSDDGRFGASPDGLCSDDGLLELKNPEPATQVKYLLALALPDEYACQCHGQLIVSGRAFVDFVSYCPPLPPFMVRVRPGKFTDRLRETLEEFWTKYTAAWDRIRALEGRESEAA